MRITLFHGNDSNAFLGDMAEHLANNHEVRVCAGIDNEDKLLELLRWSDMAWLDWASAHAVRISRLPKQCRIIIRLHSYEANSGFIPEINWQNVDRLVFVSPLVEAIFRASFPEIHQNADTRLIHNGVNLSRFTLKTSPEKTHRFANVTYGLDLNKNLPMVLQCFQAIARSNPQATLHIAGKTTCTDVQKFRQSLYLQHMITALGLKDRVTFHGFVEDMNHWLEGMDQLISCSIFESFGYNIAEAMAKGVVPLIHNFPEAHAIFPREHIFNTVEECAEMALETHDPKALRQFIADNYSADRQMAAIDALMAELSAGAH